MKGKFKEIVSKFPGWLYMLQKSPSVEGLAEFVNSFVYGSSRFGNVHEEVFADGFYPVEVVGFGDYSISCASINSFIPAFLRIA